MDYLYWAESFHFTPSQVRAERVRDMRNLAFVHGAAAEGREMRRKQDESNST